MLFPCILMLVRIRVLPFLEVVLRRFGGIERRSDIHPERIRKLARPNVIIPETLLAAGYQLQYPLRAAMREWRALRPDEWQ